MPKKITMVSLVQKGGEDIKKWKLILCHAVRQISLAAALTLQARWQELGGHVGGLNCPVTCVILKSESAL